MGLEAFADVVLCVGVLSHLGSVLLCQGLGMGEPLFDLARAGVELCFDWL